MKRKKLVACAVGLFSIAILTGSILGIRTLFKKQNTLPAYVYPVEASFSKIMDKEEEASFRFLWDSTNTNKESKGFGLVLDRSSNLSMCSVASVGYALAGCGIGAERGYITKEEAEERALLTLQTMLNHAEQAEGFFYHFLDKNTAKRYGNCEVSIIDTAIFTCGALFAGEYFGGEVKELADKLYQRINWNWYRNPDTNQFYMEYKPEVGYHTGSWGVYAEQLMLYFLGAASPTYPVPPDMLYQISRQTNLWIGMPVYIMSPANSIFTHQYSHAWFPLKNTVDKLGIDWYANSVAATLQARQFCIDTSSVFKTFGKNSWGLTACDGISGYNGGYGANPNNKNDGTIAPCGAAGSAPFSPKYVSEALEHYYSIDGLLGEYGLIDAYNLEKETPRLMKDYLGIDKGISLVMLENARTGLIWNYMQKNEYVLKGMRLVGITKANKKIIQNAEELYRNEIITENLDITYQVAEDLAAGTVLTITNLDKTKQGKLSFSSSNKNSSSSSFDVISFYAKGNAEILITIFDANHTALFTCDKVNINSSKWKEYTIDISKISELAEKFDTVEFTITSEEDTLFLDEVCYRETKDSVRNVVLSERPYVGSALHAEFDYLSENTDKKIYVTYEWQRSSNPNEPYKTIENADSPVYTPVSEDVGQFIRVIITPVDKKGNTIGISSISSNNCAVTETIPKAPADILQKVEYNKQ